jgi:hypothetical protein
MGFVHVKGAKVGELASGYPHPCRYVVATTFIVYSIKYKNVPKE